MSNIGRVIFYKTINNQGQEIIKAHIFYKDGTTESVSAEEGYKAVLKVAEEENIKNIKELKEYMSRDDNRVKTMSAEDFVNKFDSFKWILPSAKDKLESTVPVKKISVNEDAFDSASYSLDEKELDEDDEELDDSEEELIEKRPGFIRRTLKTVGTKIKNSSLVKKLTVFTLAVAVGLGIYSCAARNTKSGQMHDSNIDFSQVAPVMDQVDDVDFAEENEYQRLLERTTVKSQHDAMKLIGENIDYFNGDFANKFLEEGKDIKAALSWDEMMALQLAYNNYSKEEIRAIFNGAEIKSSDYDGYYKNATLQLMGAYVLETRDVQVDSYKYLTSTEGQNFVKKYNEMFLQAKEATGSVKVDLVNEFYAELYKDFPIADEVREEGISHAQSRAEVVQYKLAVTPIVAASEILFQNLEIDHTLSDKAIAYFNDLGLCNLAEEQFERAEIILLSSTIDTTQPTYEEFRSTKIEELKSKGNYTLDDDKRDLSQLDAFKLIVNKQVECFDNITEKSTGTSSSSNKTTSGGSSYVSTSTKTNTTYRTETKKETTSNREEAIKKSSESKVEQAEAEVDKQIEIENANNKAQAEADAEKKRQELQAEADKQAQKNEEEVKKDEEDFQNKVNEANENINNGGVVNENDFGSHDVNFDDKYTDDNGNLNDSIKDITTDGTGANKPLPDPNVTGAAFDAKAPTANTSNNSSNTSNSNNSTNTSSSDGFYTEEVVTPKAKQQVIDYSAPAKTNEEIVDEYINSLESDTNDIVKTLKK